MALVTLLRGVRVRSVARRRGTRPSPSRLARPLVLESLEGRLCPSITFTIFAIDFPNVGNAGPYGIAFPGSGGVLVTDAPGNVRLFPTDTDGQFASDIPALHNYGTGNAFGLAQVGDAIYMTQQTLGRVVQIKPDGTLDQDFGFIALPSATGIVANPVNGHLFVSNTLSLHQILDVDPLTKTVRVFYDGGNGTGFDGLTISADGSTLYAARRSNGRIIGFDTTTAQIVFMSDPIPGGPDGVAEGIGPLAGKLYVNTNGNGTNTGTIVEVDIATNTQTVIRSGRSRGDFVTIDPHDNSALFTSTDRIVRAMFPFGAAQSLTVGGFPSPSTAGTPGSITVTALDQNGMLATGYTGTVHFTSSDSQAGLPMDYTFTAADNGVHTFDGVTLTAAGSQAITVTDTSDPRLTATQAGIVVTPAATTTLTVAFAATTQAGEPRALTVTAQDQYGNTTPGYTGTVYLTTSDGQALLEYDHTFTAADQGIYAFGVEMITAGTQSLTATDVDSGISSTVNVEVTPAPAVSFTLTAPASVASGTPFDVTVTAQDPYGNTDVNYQGTVTFTTSDPDPGVMLPADYTFQPSDAGQVTFSGGVTLITPGDQTITVTDTNSGINGSATVTVTSGPSQNRGSSGIGLLFDVAPEPRAVPSPPAASSAPAILGKVIRSSASPEPESGHRVVAAEPPGRPATVLRSRPVDKVDVMALDEVFACSDRFAEG